MEMGVWLPWLCILGLVAATSGDQWCHNSDCKQTNFRDYTNCIQTSCRNTDTCQCSNVQCNTCQTSDRCCQQCCQNTRVVRSSCNDSCQGNTCQTSNCQTNNCQSNCQKSTCQTNNCQSNNCQSNCQSNCVPTERIMTCNDINCRTCRGGECMGCCEYKGSTERPEPQRCDSPMPNITITVNQPPIHITTGPVLNNISLACPNPANPTCPIQQDCCQIPSTRCVQSNNPVSPYCYTYPQQVCGAQCQAPQPAAYIPPPQPQPQYTIRYLPAPQPIPAPTYISQPVPQCPLTGCPTAPLPQPQYVIMPQPQYVPIPQPQYVPVQQPQCPTGGCAPAPLPYYVPPPSQGCVGQWPYTRCGVAGGGGSVVAVPLTGAQVYPSYMPVVNTAQLVLLPNGTYALAGVPSTPTLRRGEVRRKSGTKRSGDDSKVEQDDEE